MSQGRYPFHEAHAAASLFLANVAHRCERIAIAGSMRRHISQWGHWSTVPEHVTVGDIEIVAIPLFSETPAVVDLFGDEIAAAQPVNLLFERVAEIYEPWPGAKWGGPKTRKIAAPRAGDTGAPIVLELYTAAPATWGYIFALRTGPLPWNDKGVVLRRAWGGLKPDDITFKGGMMYRGGNPEPLDVPTEEDFFRALGIPYLPPHERSLAAVQQLREAA